MKHEPVKSSNLESVGYDAETRKMQVRFKGGSVYEYDEVPAEAHQALLRSSSPGAHLSAHVAQKYSYKRLS